MMGNSPATAATGRWLITFKPNPNAVVRLFCLPYAGGSALIYRPWSQQLSADVEVLAVQLPGRTNRMHETPATHLPELIEALAPALSDYLDKPYAFFGHSMGALIAFELVRSLRREGRALPRRLFVSGRSAPQLNRDHLPLHNLPEPELLKELRRLNGTPREILEHPELMDLVLPVLRADFSICDTYGYTEEPPLEIPITAFGGMQDVGVPRANLETWGAQTTAEFKLRMLPGDHFFLHTNAEPLLRTLDRELHALVGS